MPFPWEKARENRISRLVADLHQSPKRGGSFVVETGFPNSLVDLFVKSRDRFLKGRRSSTKTKSSSPQSFPFPSPSPSPSSNGNQSSSSSEDLGVKETDSIEVQIESNSPTICVVGSGCQNLETTREIPICKSDRSPSTRIKRSFIKKLVPKKLRHRKKLRKSKNKDQSGVDVHKSDETEEEKQGLDDDVDGESQTGEEICREVGDKISTCVQLLQVESVKDKSDNVCKGKTLSGFLIMILFVIVLGGLVGGKGIALLLTLVWCLLLRFIGRQCRC